MSLEHLELISMLVGWTYLMAWNFSSYPLNLLHYKTKSVAGFSLDFGLMNTTCHLLYSMYTVGGLIYPYMGTGIIQVNDLLFPTHCFLATSVTLAQWFIYDTGKQKGFTPWVVWMLATQALIIMSFFFCEGILGYELPHSFNTFKVAGYCNTMITFVKYSPQIILNYQRKSTEGLSIPFFMLDLTGGMLSIFQQFIDLYISAERSGNWDEFSIFSNNFNIIKFSIGMLTLTFGMFIAFQHYVLYRPVEVKSSLRKNLLFEYNQDVHRFEKVRNALLTPETRHHSISDTSVLPRGTSLLSTFEPKI